MSSAGKEKLLIHAVGPEWVWLQVDRNGQVIGRGRCNPDQPDWPAQGPVTVLVDAGDCIGLALDLPEMPPARLEKALRWAAEEHLASSAEDEHVVAGPRADDGRLNCVVISNESMNALTERLSGLSTEVLVPDALCLPWQPGQVSLVPVADRVLARWGDWSFGSFESDLFIDMLEPVAPANADWVWYGQELPDALAERSGRLGKPNGLEALIARTSQSPVNLLQGPWAPSSAFAARSYWRWAAGLVVVAVALVLSSAALELHQLKRQAESLQTEINTQFYRAFPDVPRVVRHREQAERELARLRFGESAGLLDLMNRAAPVIDGQAQIQLDGINYRDGLLELSLRAPDVAALDQFERRLRALDLNAVVQSASMDAEGASGRIRITARAP
jgi:general secretion pathway protein L